MGESSESCNATQATTLYLRHGGLLSTEKPSMDAVTKADWDHVKIVHSETQHFHSDFAHTDYMVEDGALASWSTPPLADTFVLKGPRVSANLWIGTNAAHTDFNATLMRFDAQGNSWSPLCSATANTQFRESAETPLLLPGKPMMATGANGGYSVALPLQLELAAPVTLQTGDVLRVDVSGSATGSESRVDHRVWHNPKWASTFELPLEPSSLDLKWVRPSNL